MPNEKALADAADALWHAEDDIIPIGPLSALLPDLDVDGAYAIQQLNIDRRIANGATLRGHKVGLTAKAMQRLLGVNEPDFGQLVDDMFIDDGAEIPASRFCAPRIEVEVAFVLKERLEGPSCTVADVVRATEFVMPSLELIDSRIADWKIKLVDTIADNGSAAGVVLGGTPRKLEGLDLRVLGAVLERNGKIIETGAAGAVLGNPALAVAWLANKLHSFGIALDPGQVVLPGSCTAAVPVAAGDVIRAEFDRLGAVSLRFS